MSLPNARARRVEACKSSYAHYHTARAYRSAFAQIPTSWRKAFAAVRDAVEDEARAHRSTAEGLDRLLVRLGAFRDDRVRAEFAGFFRPGRQ